MARSDAEAVWDGSGAGATCDSVGMTEVGGSNDATKEGSISVVLVIGATMEGLGTSRSGGVGYPINSLNVAPRLLETRVSGTSIDEL